MKLELFKPEFFERFFKIELEARQDMARACNRLLNEYIESLPLVYAEKENLLWHNVGFQGNKECEHLFTQEYIIATNPPQVKIVCTNCGKKLKAKWEVDNENI